jgi:hypothetical protein
MRRTPERQEEDEMTLRSRLALCAMVLGTLAIAPPVHADSHGKKPDGAAAKSAKEQTPAGPTAEDRAKMADAHQKMAECLRSTRPIQECRAEMKKTHDGWAQGMTCPHGESCPHGEACPHGDACDGSCKHGGKHGDAHGAMCENGKGKGKGKAETGATPPTSH